MNWKTILLYGGGGLAVIAGGWYLYSNQSANAAAPDQQQSYFPPSVVSPGGGGIDTTGSGSSTTSTGTMSTDQSIAQLIASQLQQATIDSTTTIKTAQLAKDTALAGFANSLAKQKDAEAAQYRLTGLTGANALKENALDKLAALLGKKSGNVHGGVTFGSNGSISIDAGAVQTPKPKPPVLTLTGKDPDLYTSGASGKKATKPPKKPPPKKPPPPPPPPPKRGHHHGDGGGGGGSPRLN